MNKAKANYGCLLFFTVAINFQHDDFFLLFLVSSMQLWALGLQGRNGLFSVFVLARAVWCGGDAFLQCCCDASENDSIESLCVCVASIESLRLCLCLPCVYERDF
jgi:hypothetical protein